MCHDDHDIDAKKPEHCNLLNKKRINLKPEADYGDLQGSATGQADSQVYLALSSLFLLLK